MQSINHLCLKKSFEPSYKRFIGFNGHENWLKSVIQLRYLASITSLTMFPFSSIKIVFVNCNPISVYLPLLQLLLIFIVDVASHSVFGAM